MLIVGAELFLRSRIVGGKLCGQIVLDLLDERIAFGLAVGFGVERILEAIADIGLELAVIGFVELRCGESALGLAGFGNQLIDCRDDLLDLFMGKLDGGQDDFFSLFLGAGLDHDDSVLVPNDHDVDGSGCALGIGGVDDELAIDAADTHGAHGGAEGNVGESERGRGSIDANHVGIVILVGGEDQRDDLSLIAESIREERANGTVNLPAGENFLLAGPAFALDEAGVHALFKFHREGEEVDSLPGVGRGNSGGQNDSFARGNECGARGLLGHAAGLKDQTLAAGKLDSYFMLGRHRVLFSVFFAWETCSGKTPMGAGRLSRGETHRAGMAHRG